MKDDFLSKFSKDNYDNTKKNEKEIEKKLDKNKKEKIIENKEIINDKPIFKSVENKNDFKEEKIDSIKNTELKPIKLIDETTIEDSSEEYLDGELEIDHSYHQKKLIRYGIIIGGVIAGCIAIYLTFFLMNQVTIKNFVNTTISDARTWAAKNRIELEVENVYSLEYDTNIVVSQNKKVGSKVQKGTTILLEVSLGPDPDERINIPDFSDMNYYAIEEWITKNKANNVRITRVFDEIVPENQFVRMEFRSSSVSSNNYTRKDILTLYISRGPEVFEKNIEVPDFTNRSKFEVEDWASKNDIILTIHEADSDTIMEGMVINQSIPALEKITKQTEMSVTISLGKAAIVPNFAEFTSETAMQASSDLEIRVDRHYSDTISYGLLISQSKAVGARLIKDKKVSVVYSLGRPYISGLVGMRENEISSYFFDFYVKKANITVATTYVTDCDDKGSVIWASHDNEFVAMDATIQVYICKSTINTFPDFSRFTADEARNLIMDLDITVNEIYSTTTFGKLIFQSKTAGTPVTYDKSVNVTYSLGDPYLTGLLNMQENQLANYFFDFQRRGANIVYETNYANSDTVNKGSVISAVDTSGNNVNDRFIKMSDINKNKQFKVIITISDGPPPPQPPTP